MGDDINWKTKAIKNIEHQRKINPFQIKQSDIEKANNIQIESIDNNTCNSLYNKYGICWFRCIMQIILYEESFTFVEKAGTNNGFYIFLNEFKNHLKFKQNCYKCTIDTDTTILFHAENLYTQIIFLLNENIDEIFKLPNVKEFASEIINAYPIFFIFLHQNSSMYKILDGKAPNAISINTCVVLSYLVGYEGKPYVLKDKYYSRFIDITDNVEPPQNIQVISYSALEINLNPGEKISIFKQLLKLFQKNKIHTKYLGFGMAKFQNNLALHIQHGDTYYQLCGLTLGNLPSKLPYGHIISIVEEKNKKFPFFTGAEITRDFYISDSLILDNGYFETLWPGQFEFNLDMGFRECFYKKCEKYDCLVYTIYEKIVKILHAPIHYQSIFEYIIENNNIYFKLKGNQVECQSGFEKYSNYVELINQTIVDVSLNSDEIIYDLIKRGVVSKQFNKVISDKFIRFKKEHTVVDKQRICTLLKIIDMGVSNVLNDMDVSDVSDVLNGLKHIFNNFIKLNAPSTFEIAFEMNNIGRAIRFSTLMIWFDKYISEKLNVPEIKTECTMSKIDQFRYYVPDNNNIVSILDLVLLHGSTVVIDDSLVTSIIADLKSIQEQIQKNQEEILLLQKNQEILLLQKIIETLETFKTSYTNITYNSEKNLFICLNTESPYANLNEVSLSTMEKSAQNGDAAAYYFVKTLNTMIKTKTKTGGGRRKYNKLKNIFQKKRKNNSKRFL